MESSENTIRVRSIISRMGVKIFMVASRDIELARLVFVRSGCSMVIGCE